MGYKCECCGRELAESERFFCNACGTYRKHSRSDEVVPVDLVELAAKAEMAAAGSAEAEKEEKDLGRQSFATACRKKVENFIKKMEKEPDKVCIVNAGRMNHGKSSLFNSLLGDEKIFAVKDIRTTVCNQEEEADGILYIDTPGLDAQDVDSEQAYEAYKRASIILFVHKLNIGELHESELKELDKIKALFPGEEYFWQHLCIVLTVNEPKDEAEAAGIEKIAQKIADSLKEKKVPIFKVSNLRWLKGYKEQDKKKKQIFLKKSGIEELKAFIRDNKEKWQEELRHLKEEKLKAYKEEVIDELVAKRNEIDKAIKEKKEQLQAGQDKLKERSARTFEEIREKIKDMDEAQRDAENYRNTARELEAKHEKERY